MHLHDRSVSQLCPVKRRLVSSAKRRENMFCDNIPRSFTQLKKSRGPKMDPCGTLHFMSRGYIHET